MRDVWERDVPSSVVSQGWIQDLGKGGGVAKEILFLGLQAKKGGPKSVCVCVGGGGGSGHTPGSVHVSRVEPRCARHTGS